MRKKLAIMLLSTGLIAQSVFASSDKVVATYKANGKVQNVKYKDVDNFVKSMFENQPQFKDKKIADLDENVQKGFIASYINFTLAKSEAKKLGLQNDKKFKERMKVVEDQMLLNFLIGKQIETMVTDKKVDAKYNELVKSLQGQKEVKSSHILVESEDKAKEIKKKLNKGAKFEDLVKEYSKDESSKERGGELGFLPKGRLVPEFESKLFSMKKGQISDPVKTEYGWHIIKKIDERPISIPTKEESMLRIKGELAMEAERKYIESLAKKADIKIKISGNKK